MANNRFEPDNNLGLSSELDRPSSPPGGETSSDTGLVSSNNEGIVNSNFETDLLWDLYVDNNYDLVQPMTRSEFNKLYDLGRELMAEGQAGAMVALAILLSNGDVAHYDNIEEPNWDISLKSMGLFQIGEQYAREQNLNLDYFLVADNRFDNQINFFRNYLNQYQSQWNDLLELFWGYYYYPILANQVYITPDGPQYQGTIDLRDEEFNRTVSLIYLNLAALGWEGLDGKGDDSVLSWVDVGEGLARWGTENNWPARNYIDRKYLR